MRRRPFARWAVPPLVPLVDLPTQQTEFSEGPASVNGVLEPGHGGVALGQPRPIIARGEQKRHAPGESRPCTRASASRRLPKRARKSARSAERLRVVPTMDRTTLMRLRIRCCSSAVRTPCLSCSAFVSVTSSASPPIRCTRPCSTRRGKSVFLGSFCPSCATTLSATSRIASRAVDDWPSAPVPQAIGARPSAAVDRHTRREVTVCWDVRCPEQTAVRNNRRRDGGQG